LRNLVLPIILLFLPSLTYSQTYWNLEPVWVKTEPDSGKNFGMRVETGDINGDGCDDICVSYGTYIEYEWILHDIYISAPSMDTIPDLSWMTTIGDSGYTIKAIGDLNNDNYDDLIFSNSSTKAYIFWGGPAIDSIPDFIIKEDPGRFGESISVGDLNNDGYDDLVIGSYTVDKVYIYYGDSIMDDTADLILHGEESNSNFGQSLSSGYDINNDGYDDVVIAAPAYSALGFWQGRIYIFYGGENMDTIPDLWIDGRKSGDFWGQELTLARDFCSMGTDTPYADFWVGGRGMGDRDTAFFYNGGNPMDSTLDEIIIGSDSLLIGYGYSLAGVDNINNDQWGELLVGACYYPYNLGEDRGKVHLYLGGSTFDTVPDAYAVGEIDQEIGWLVKSCDINGDGINEALFTNYAAGGLGGSTKTRVWICRYIGIGVEQQKPKIEAGKLRISPNPFFSNTSICVHTNQIQKPYSLKIFDITGRLVADLGHNAQIDKNSSVAIFRWNGTGKYGNQVSSGVYIVQFECDKHLIRKQIIKLK